MTIANVTFEGGGLRNRDIASGAAITADKVIHQYCVNRLVTANDTTVVTAVELPIHTVPTPTTELMNIQASVFQAATGDATITVDLLRSTAGGAFATVLTTPIEFDNSVAARTVIAGVIDEEDGIQDDIYKLSVTVAGNQAGQALGLLVALTVQDRLV